MLVWPLTGAAQALASLGHVYGAAVGRILSSGTQRMEERVTALTMIPSNLLEEFLFSISKSLVQLYLRSLFLGRSRR